MVSPGDRAPDEMTCEWSSWRFAVAWGVIGVAAAAVGRLAAEIAFRTVLHRAGATPPLEALTFVGIYAISFAAVALLLARRMPTRLSFAGDGIDLAAARHDGVYIPYGAMVSVRARWWWPFTVLEVVVDAAHEQHLVRRDRTGRPMAGRRTPHHIRFTVPLAGLAVSATEIEAHLRSRAQLS